MSALDNGGIILRNIQLIIEYDGSRYAGWQKQAGKENLLTFARPEAILSVSEMTKKSNRLGLAQREMRHRLKAHRHSEAAKTTFRSGREARDTAAKSTNQGGTTGRYFPLVPRNNARDGRFFVPK